MKGVNIMTKEYYLNLMETLSPQDQAKVEQARSYVAPCEYCMKDRNGARCKNECNCEYNARRTLKKMTICPSWVYDYLVLRKEGENA